MKFLLLLVVTLPFVSSAQRTQNVLLKGKINSSKIRDLRIFEFGLNNQFGNARFDTSFQINPSESFTFSLAIDHKGMYGIQDGIWSMFTHDIFLRFGDTITLAFAPRPQYEKQMKGLHPVFTAHIMSVKARYPGNITFFDSLEYQRPLRYGKIKGESLSAYKARCDSFYRIWGSILNNYKKKDRVSDDFLLFAKAELYSRYITWLTDPAGILPRSQFPAKYFTLPDTVSFNNPVYMFGLKTYCKPVHSYNLYFLNERKVHDKYANLKSEFNDLLNNYTGTVRDKLIGAKVYNYAHKGNSYFDTAYALFLQNCQSPQIREIVKNKVEQSGLDKKGNTNKLSWKAVFDKTNVYTARGKLVPFSKIVSKDKLIVIDCWATWCVPCRTEIPYLKKMANRFNDAVQFISISFDKKEKAWKQFLSEPNEQLTGGQYRLYNGSTSTFAKYLRIESIPRYILLSKGGVKVLEKDLPVPSMGEHFANKIQKYLD